MTADLSANIRTRALELGYADCGIIGLEEVAGYAGQLDRRIGDFPDDRMFLERFTGLADPRQKFPWARSIVVGIRNQGVYKIPARLRGHIGKSFLLDARRRPDTDEYAAGDAFQAYLESLGLRVAAEREFGLVPLRLAGEKAGLGRIRRNNFFYAAGGSAIWLEAWLIDRELELKAADPPKPCPENCDKCLTACPTASLSKPFSMRPTRCVAFLTTLTRVSGIDTWVDHPCAEALGGWVYGCDACQDACPFNARAWREERDFPGLAELGETLDLARIPDLDHEYLRRELTPKFWYLPEDRAWQWKVNALNAMKNQYEPEYRAPIQRALHDADERVRAMAAWAEKSLREQGRF